MPKRQQHTYILNFTLHATSHPRYEFPGWRCIKSSLPWTSDNKPKIKKLAETHLDYMFESWSGLSIEPVCSCCRTGGGK